MGRSQAGAKRPPKPSRAASRPASEPDSTNGHETNRAAGGSKPPGRDWSGLAVVATPIGNLGDITRRAARILAEADAVICEDSRVTGKLLAHLGVRAPMIAYHDHNADKARPAILARLRRGEALALVSDAGTPLVSDPGFKLVREAAEEGLALTALPGPSSVLTALVLAAIPCERFLFQGFLPAKSQARRAVLAELAPVPAALVFFESPNRLADSLADMAKILGERPAAAAREMTKLFEEVRRAPLGELAASYRDRPPPKGELVLVVGPPLPQTPPAEADLDSLIADARKSMSLRDAAQAVAIATGLRKKDVYARALALAGDKP
jgi:16S rRNA (cytidine1402-2'-O)-methyltransferase